MKSNLHVAMIDEMSAADLSALDVATLSEFQKEIDATIALWRKRKATLDDSLHLKYGQAAADARLAKQKDSGTTHHVDGDFRVTCDAKPTVTWDQKGLGELRQRIASAGEDPKVYVTEKIELTVAEVTYKGWPDNVRKEFEKFRTVKVRSNYKIEAPK